MGELTPLMKQYLGIKQAHPDAILFFRMGDFYELFYEDALRAAPVMEVQLTSRDKNSPDPVPMCGVPYHSAQGYLQKLLNAGLKVAVCEQMEDPTTAKGIVRREVVRILTPSLVGDPELVPETTQNYLVAVSELADGFDVAVTELLGGRLLIGTIPSTTELFDTLLTYPPKELLIETAAQNTAWLSKLRKYFPKAVVTLRDFQPAISGTETAATAASRAYLLETQKVPSGALLLEPQPLLKNSRLRLDATSLQALEILQGQSRDEAAPCLYNTLNFTCTAMGRRLLRDWLAQPLAQKSAIEARHAAVQSLSENPDWLEKIRAQIAEIRDLERLATKTALGLSFPRDLVNIREILGRLPSLKTLLDSAPHHSALAEVKQTLDPLPTLFSRLQAALEDVPPPTYREGGVFRDSFHPEIAQYRKLSTNAKGSIAEIEAREREITGISSLKIKYSRVFGYTIEVTKAQIAKVPSTYTRKQTIANGERYVTEELKSFESKVISADFKLRSLEENLFLALRKEVAAHTAALLKNARLLAELDVLLSFSTAARRYGYVRPAMYDGFDLNIRDGRHPVVERTLGPGEFIPNSLEMNDECRSYILTGPNMAGKSTIMRQAALILVMAHCGSFVPAQAAQLPITDAVFTRIGASDDLARGQSTFMVEMSEVARILAGATPRSFILIDEIGRGTSTFDGLSLAWSLLEHLHTETRGKLLFATHFQEVTALEKTLPGLRNANVLVNHHAGEVVFLHRMVPGICNRSYGIEVARLAGLPSSVLQRAKAVLGYLDSVTARVNPEKPKTNLPNTLQIPLFEAEKISESRTGLDSAQT